MNERMIEGTNEWNVYKQTNKQTNQPTNKQTHETSPRRSSPSDHSRTLAATHALAPAADID